RRRDDRRRAHRCARARAGARIHRRPHARRLAVVVHPEMGFKLQGSVTTVVVGNCGFGAAPWPVAQRMARTLHPGRAVHAWDGSAAYLAYLDGTPPSCNVAALVGHGTVRASVMGTTRRGPDAGELAHMCELVRRGNGRWMLWPVDRPDLRARALCHHGRDRG